MFAAYFACYNNKVLFLYYNIIQSIEKERQVNNGIQKILWVHKYGIWTWWRPIPNHTNFLITTFWATAININSLYCKRKSFGRIRISSILFIQRFLWFSALCATFTLIQLGNSFYAPWFWNPYFIFRYECSKLRSVCISVYTYVHKLFIYPRYAYIFTLLCVYQSIAVMWAIRVGIYSATFVTVHVCATYVY